LAAGELDFFNNVGSPVFAEVDTVANGLGPRFNFNSCAGCHTHPAVGGSSPATNPQFTQAPTIAPGNTIPAFITLNGPIREARFVRNPNGSPDGGVHDIFTIAGRSDAPAGCRIQQPDFATQVANHNVIFRIPTPTFGLGFIESITETTIKSNLASDPFRKGLLGITGHVNTTGNDGSVTRFGWKAQNKSLTIFAGEAYNVEQGVTNEVFMNEREENPDCAKNPTPESDSTFNVGSIAASDVAAFRTFMRFLDQPQPVTSFGKVTAASIQNGRNLFQVTGCALCHTPSLTTGSSSCEALSNKQTNLFSDLAVHHMGSHLADGVSQGAAGPDEFRSAPLWGLGQRIFFLHDGRTNDLLEAIKAHSGPGSEANAVTLLFDALLPSQKQDVLNFLRSL
jgi:CxxC motif-containing protein (DUF1111 family)